jgi:chromosome segregation ATPase
MSQANTFTQLKELASKLQKSSKAVKEKKSSTAEFNVSLRDFQRRLDTAAMELAHCHDDKAKADLTKQLREYKQLHKKLKNEVEGAGSVGSIATAPEMMKHGLAVQEASMASLSRSLRTLHEAKEIARDVVPKLQQQTEQMVSIHDEVLSVDCTLHRANNTIKRMQRRV